MPGEEARTADAATEPDRSGEHNVAAVGFVELPDAPVPVDGESANSNHRADIVLPRAPVDAVGGGRSSADEAYRRRREDDTTATVLDAPYSMHVSEPPQPRTSWALRLWVALMCGIIAAAGVVAWKNHKGGGAAPQASSTSGDEPARAEAGGGATLSPDLVSTEPAPAKAAAPSPAAGDEGGAVAAADQPGDTQGASEAAAEAPTAAVTRTEEAEAKPARSRRASAPERAASAREETQAAAQEPAAAPAEPATQAGVGAPPEVPSGGLPPGLGGGIASRRTQPSPAAVGTPREAAASAPGEAAAQAEPDLGRRGHPVDTASLPQLPQNPYETDAL